MQGLGSLAQDISIVHVFLCYGNKKAYVAVDGAALTTALLASLCLTLLYVLCAFVSVCISIHRIFLHGNPKGIAEPMRQISCGVVPCFKSSEIPRISRILSLSFLTVLHSETYRVFIPGEFIPKNV